jgi:hypothetical protein
LLFIIAVFPYFLSSYFSVLFSGRISLGGRSLGRFGRRGGLENFPDLFNELLDAKRLCDVRQVIALQEIASVPG